MRKLVLWCGVGKNLFNATSEERLEEIYLKVFIPLKMVYDLNTEEVWERYKIVPGMKNSPEYIKLKVYKKLMREAFNESSRD